MYTPKHFQQHDWARISELIRTNSLATIIGNGLAGMFANHIPLLLREGHEEAITLQGHIAKANELSTRLQDGSEVLVIFQGVDGYISPGWYPSKHEDAKVVPTWNYIAVHLTGKIRFIHDLEWKAGFLNSLTSLHESKMDSPWKMGDAPEDYLARMMDGIVGIEIEAREIQAKWKLSQNQSLVNRLGVMTALKEDGSDLSIKLAEEINGS